MPLTDMQVRNAKPADKPYKKADGGGLYLFVHTSGGRLWRMDYRFEGKRKTLAFGSYPDVSLTDARAMRDEARKLLAKEVDPSEQRKAQEAQEVAKAKHTFEFAARLYIDRLRHDKAAEATIAKNEWMLFTLADDLLKIPVADVTPADVLSVLQRVEASGRLESARRLRSTISGVFAIAIKNLMTNTDPSAVLVGVTKKPIVKNRAAIVAPKRLGWLLNEIDAYDGWPTLRCALQFIALTATRPGEVRRAEWVEFDLSQRTWTIPAERMKRPSLTTDRLEHMVPLSDQAVSVLMDVKQLTGGKKFVFSSIRDFERPLSENALNAALRRIGVTTDEHVAHGFRSSFSTILNELREDSEIIEICLAHQDPNGVRRIYNRAVRWPERVALMQKWADLLDEYRGRKVEEEFDFSDLLG